MFTGPVGPVEVLFYWPEAKIRHDILIQCHGNYTEMKKFKYMPAIDIPHKKLGVLGGAFLRVWVFKKTPRQPAG